MLIRDTSDFIPPTLWPPNSLLDVWAILDQRIIDYFINLNLADKVQTFISFYLLNTMLKYVGIILLVEFLKYLESFSMT